GARRALRAGGVVRAAGLHVRDVLRRGTRAIGHARARLGAVRVRRAGHTAIVGAHRRRAHARARVRGRALHALARRHLADLVRARALRAALARHRTAVAAQMVGLLLAVVGILLRTTDDDDKAHEHSHGVLQL